ncbi:MAG: phage integrase SAM-like domain-containing protein [Bacteroidetes bacterium]|nr:phage integrase SAM-like domain-containing protein [Bacteroidota bacterium]
MKNMTVRFYLKRPNGDRISGIYAQLHFNQTVFKYYLLEKVHPEDWNFKTQRARSGVRSKKNLEFNQRLNYVATKISDAFYNYQNTHEGRPPVPKVFRELLDEIFDKKSQARIDRETSISFWGFLTNLIERMESGSRVHLKRGTPLANSTIKNMRNLKNHLQSYEVYSSRKLVFDSIDMRFYYGFIDYLTKVKKANINSIGKLITNIKIVMREALELGYTNNMCFTHRRFRSSSVESETVYLNEKEINEMQELDLTDNKRLERVRDLFIVGCYTGLRYSDLAQVTTEKIDNGILTVCQIKTGEYVHIPLQMVVKEIIAKYEGKLPEAISNQKFNEYLKDVCKCCGLLKRVVSVKSFVAGKRILLTKPKYFFVTSHTARRSFATNEYLARDIQTAEIRAITGHKTDESFYKYIRVTPPPRKCRECSC